VNPGFYGTGFNDRGVDAALQWFDPATNFTPAKTFSAAAEFLAQQLDPQAMADRIVDVVLSDDSHFRNVLPVEMADFIRQTQHDAWDAKA
jgi:hypothetical protein